MPALEIEDLHVEADGHPILWGLTLSAAAGEIHALMGPNGSGKSTLANTLLDGRIVSSGGLELAGRLGAEGFDSFRDAA